MAKSDGKRRPIDVVRDSALSMRVGNPEDGAICKMIEITGQLHIVSEHAIYAVQLADDIDPDRTNSAVPNANQRVLCYGAKDAAVGRILLTAHDLFKASHIGREFPEKEALSLAFELLGDLAGMLDIHRDMRSVVEATTQQMNVQVQKDRSVALPSLSDSENRFHAFAQKVGHAVDTMRAISRLFYPNELSRKWIDSMVCVTAQKHGKDDPLAKFMVESRKLLLFMREIRNMVEHPKDNARVVVHNFSLTPEMTLRSPYIDIVLPDEPTASEEVPTFMADATEALLSTAESFIALLCSTNAKSLAGFPLMVVELPVERRPPQNPYQRFSYAINMSGQIRLLG